MIINRGWFLRAPTCFSRNGNLDLALWPIWLQKLLHGGICDKR